MTRTPWHKHYHTDALSGMASLPVDLRGVYYTLLDLMYDRGEDLAESDQMMAARMCCSVRKWKSYRTALIQMGKIELTSEGKITNKRFQTELKKSRKLAENGAKGGRARAENQKNDKENSADAQKGFKQTPKPQNQKPDKKDKTKVLSKKDSENSPVEKPKPKKRRTAAANGSRLPPDWQPTDKDLAFATKHELTPQEIEDEADRFRDHWTNVPGPKGRKLNWEAAWRTWITRPEYGPVARKKQAAERAASRHYRTPTQPKYGSGGLAAAGLRLVAEARGYGEQVS